MVDTSPRPRFGGSKVRTGCITCKARRVKCDETKPECVRCTKGGRQCSYADPSQPRRNHANTFVIVKYVSAVPQSPSLVPSLDNLERRSLDYYQYRAASELAGAFAGHIWGKLLLRVAQHESAIRHAIIALAALHENFGTSTNLAAPISDFAMQQYVKAIQQVITLDMAASSRSVDVAVLSCLLFTAFESLQGHYQSALQHINSGVKILAEHKSKYIDSAPGDHYVPEKIMRKLFIRLDSQTLEIGDDSFRPPCEYLAGEVLPTLPGTFANIEHASLCFEFFMNRLHHFLQNAEQIFKDDTPVETLQEIGAMHVELVEYFHGWAAAFDNAHFPDDMPSTLVLQASHLMLGIVLNTNPLLGEMVFDPFTTDFERVVDIVERFLALSYDRPETKTAGPSSQPQSQSLSRSQSQSPSQSHFKSPTNHLSTTTSFSPTHSTPTPPPSHRSSPPHQVPHKPTFTLSLGIITPLFFISTRCRDPAVRRRALHLLSTCNRKEGIWDSALSARVAARIIAIEEAGSGATVVTAAAQVPEEARVRELDTFFGAGRRGRIRYRKSRVGVVDTGGDGEGEDGAVFAEIGGSQYHEETFEW